MNICIYRDKIHPPWTEGIKNSTWLLFEWLNQYSPSYLISRAGKKCKKDIYRTTASPHFYSAGSFIGNKPLRIREKDTVNLNVVKKLFQLNRSKKIDSYLFPESQVMFYVYLVKYIFKKPVFIWADTGITTRPQSINMIKKNCKVVDCFFCMNSHSENRIKEMSAGHAKTALIPPPVDCSRYKPLDNSRELRKKFHIPLQSNMVILFSGSLQKGRGVSFIKRAVDAILSENIEAHFVISWVENDCEKKIFEELKLYLARSYKGRVTFLGKQDELEKLFNAVDVVLLPYSGKSAIAPPLTMLEAMACGKVVVTTDIKEMDTGFVIENGINGFICKPQEECIINLLRKISSASAFDLAPIGLAARRTVLKVYDINRVGELMLRLMQNHCDSPADIN